MSRKLKKVARTVARKVAEHDLIIFRKEERFDGRNIREGYFKACEIKGKVYTVNSSALKTRASGVDVVSGQQSFEPKYKAMLLEGTYIDADGKKQYITGDDELVVREKDGTIHPRLFKITETPDEPSLYNVFYEAKLQVVSGPWYIENDELLHEERLEGGEDE